MRRVFGLKTYKLAYTHARGCEKTDNKIKREFPVLLETADQIFIVALADHVVEVCFLLETERFEPEFPVFLTEPQKSVQGTDAGIDGLRLVIFQEPSLVQLQIVRRKFRIVPEKAAHPEQIGDDCASGQIALRQIGLKLPQGIIQRNIF